MKVAKSQQYQTNTSQRQTFKGIPISRVRIKSLPACDEMIIYKVSKDDEPFLKTMLEKIDLESLYTKVKDKTDFDKWKETIESTIINISNGSIGLLGVRNKKPCGIISYNKIPSQKKYYIDHEATWPTQPDKGTKCAGKVLMRQVFGEAVEDGIEKTMAVTQNFRPRNKSSKDFCSEIGFLENKRMFTYEVNSKESHLDIVNKLDEIMDYEKISNGKNENLTNILDLS